MEHPRVKVVLAGNGGSGKTAFTRMALSGRRTRRYQPTLGVEVHPLTMQVRRGAAKSDQQRQEVMGIFYLQTFLNLAWSFAFFGSRQPKNAFLIILLLIAVVGRMIMVYYRSSQIAGFLLVPYIAWLMFATVLNADFIRLNPST